MAWKRPRTREDGQVGYRFQVTPEVDAKIEKIVARTRQSKRGFILWLIDQYLDGVDDDGRKLEEHKVSTIDDSTKTPRLEKAV